MKHDLNIISLRKRYIAGELHPLAVMQDILARIGDDPHHIWIHRLSLAEIHNYVLALQDRDPAGRRAQSPPGQDGAPSLLDR